MAAPIRDWVMVTGAAGISNVHPPSVSVTGTVTEIRRAETIDDYFATLDGFWDAI